MVTAGPCSHIAGGIRRRNVEQRIPTADVRPAEIARHHRGAVGLFHHRVVDRLERCAREGFRLQTQKAEIDCSLGDRGLDRFGHGRFEAVEFREQHVGAEQEVAGIPQIAVADVAGGGGGVRLLDESLDRMRAAFPDRLAREDVAVAGLRLVRLDAEGDDLARFGGLAAGKARGAELRHVEDDVVGGERQNHGIRVALARDRGRGRDGRP